MFFDDAATAAMEPVPGQQVFTANGSFTVPENVFRLSMVCVAVSTLSTFVAKPGPFTVCSAVGQSGGIGDGGGNGGNPGESLYYESGGFGNYIAGAGGGAGGYLGNGGDGGRASFPNPTHPFYIQKQPTPGQGGGGGGGQVSGGNDAGGGGGVGLLGVGADGAAGVSPGLGGGGGSGGANGNQGVNGYALYGGGNSGRYTDTSGGANWSQTAGGALRWKNDVDVTPGMVLTVQCPTGGGVRIMWGAGRSYPYSAGDV